MPIKIIKIDNVDISIRQDQNPPAPVQFMGPNDGCGDPTACNFCGFDEAYYTYWCQDPGSVGLLEDFPDCNVITWEPSPYNPLNCDDDPDACVYNDSYCTNYYGGNLCGALTMPIIEGTGGQSCTGCYINDVDLGDIIVNTTNSLYQTNELTGHQYTWCEFCGDSSATNYNSSLANIPSYISSPGMCMFGKCITPAQSSNLEVCNLYTIGSDVGITADNVTHDESKCIYKWLGCKCEEDGTASEDLTVANCIDCMANQPGGPEGSILNPGPIIQVNAWKQYGMCSCDGEGQTVSTAMVAHAIASEQGASTNPTDLPSVGGGNDYFYGANVQNDQITVCDTACDPTHNYFSTTIGGTGDFFLIPGMNSNMQFMKYETVACGCGNTLLDGMEEVWCDCAGQHPYSPYCGCDGTSPMSVNATTGTTLLPQYSTDLTTIPIDALDGGDNINVPSIGDGQLNMDIPCDCEGITMAQLYLKDVYGEGYGYTQNWAVKMCPDQAALVVLSTPANPILNAYTLYTYNCDPAVMDCDNNCPGDEFFGAAANECGECISLYDQQSDANWIDNCCESPLDGGSCQICRDAQLGVGAWDTPQVGAMQKIDSPSNPDTNSMDQTTVSYLTTEGGSEIFYTCNCENLTSLGDQYVNYYDIHSEVYEGDACNSCKKKNDPTRFDLAGYSTSGQAAAGILLGAPGGNIVQDLSGNYYCTCNDAANGISVDYNTGCCGSNVRDCNGNCVPQDTAAVPDCLGVCGGTATHDICGVCDGPGPLEGFCDCDENVEDCQGACGGSAVTDPCGDCVPGPEHNTYGANCWACDDPAAENYKLVNGVFVEDAPPCPNCCDYLTLYEIIEEESAEQALAQGEIVATENLETPWAVVHHIDESDFEEGTPGGVGVFDRTGFHMYYQNPWAPPTQIGSGVGSGTASPGDFYAPNSNVSIYGWVNGWNEIVASNSNEQGWADAFAYPMESLASEAPSMLGVKAIFDVPKISFRVQKVSSTNLRIVCEGAAANATVSFTIYNPDNIALQNNVYYYGVNPFQYNESNIDSFNLSGVGQTGDSYDPGTSDIANWYNGFEAASLDTSAEVSKIYYYFYIDADAPFDNLNATDIFNAVDANGNLRYPGIKRVSYVTDQSGEYMEYIPAALTESVVYNAIGSLMQGDNYIIPTPSTDLPDVPVYHVYRIEVFSGSNFIIDFTDIPGIVTPPPVYGCMEEGACNYNASANTPSECQYPEEGYYCDGSVIPVYGCMDPSAINYNVAANAVSEEYPCDYLGCMDPLADNYSQIATVDDLENPCLYSLPCNNISQTPICCRPAWFTSASPDDYAIVNNTPIANNECEICDDLACTNEDGTIYVCTDENSLSLYTGEWIPGVTISSESVCDYGGDEASNFYLRISIYEHDELTQDILNSIDWVLYDTKSNVIKRHPFMSIENISTYFSVMSGFAGNQFLTRIVSIDTTANCMWFIPIGYVDNPIWDHIEIDIMYAGNSIYQLYGKKGPHVSGAPLQQMLAGSTPYTVGENYFSTNSRGLAKIVKNGVCDKGCGHDITTLQTEYCIATIKEDAAEFTEIFLIVDTAQENADFSECYVKLVDLDNGNELVGMVGFNYNSSYKRRFVVDKKITRVGIEAKGNGIAPLAYKVLSEDGKLITYKTIL